MIICSQTFFDRSKYHIHHCQRQQHHIRATLSDYGGTLIWIKIIACELGNFHSHGEQKRFMGEEFTVMLLCFLKELSANDGITWTNIEYAEDSHSIHVDFTNYLEILQPDDMGVR